MTARPSFLRNERLPPARTRRGVVVCWLAVVAITAGAWSGAANAQVRGAARAGGSPSRAPGAPSGRAQRIESLYQHFEHHFERGEYAECLPWLEQACELTDSPRCLFNLGAVHHALMHCERARSYYEQYLSRSPYDADGDDARDALDELNRACHDRPPISIAHEPPPSVPLAPGVVPALTANDPPAAPFDDQREPPELPRDPSPRRDDRVVTWSLFGAGTIGLAGTLIAAGYGMRAERDYERHDRQNGDLDAASDPQLRAIDRRGRRYNHITLGLGAASGLLLGAGATLWILDLGSDASLDVSADGASVRYRGSF